MKITRSPLRAVQSRANTTIAVRVDDEFYIDTNADFTAAYAALRLLAPDADGETILRAMPD